jgi:hypothetical protein
MPCIAERRDYDGASLRLARLGLAVLWSELEDILTGFRLAVTEQPHGNLGAAVRDVFTLRLWQTPPEALLCRCAATEGCTNHQGSHR